MRYSKHLFIKSLRYDLSAGWRDSWKLLIALIYLLFQICVEFVLMLSSLWGSNLDLTKVTLGDMALFMFGGSKEYIPAADNPFVFPIRWFLLMSFVCICTLWFSYRDLLGFGEKILLRGQSRTIWWLSKCVWCVIIVSMIYFLGWIILLVFACITDMQLSLDVNSDIAVSIFHLSDYTDPSLGWNLSLFIFLTPWFVSVSLALFQQLMSTFIHPLFGFVCILLLLGCSAYYCCPWLIGNYAMVVRNKEIMINGMDFWLGTLLCVISSLCWVFGGRYVAKRFNILGKEGEK